MTIKLKSEDLDLDQLRIAGGIMAAAEKFHARSVSCGWYNDPKTGAAIKRNHGEMIALMHSELSEMLEGIRKGGQDKHLPHRSVVAVEAADLLLRLFDYIAYAEIAEEVALAVIEKDEYNGIRADHKIENRAKAGGKAF